jgi:preprotein translocase subunit SecF
MTGFQRLLRGETRIDFLKWWRLTLALSGILLLVSVGALVFRGLNLGIDFEGGVSWEVSAPGVSVSEVRDALEPVGEGSAKIQTVGSDILRVQGPEASPEHEGEVRQVLADLAGTDVGDVSVSSVGASWGSDITESAVRALVLFFAAVLLYLSVRLEWRMAVAAIGAVVHDVLISVGVYALFQFEVTPGTVIAFLTILGFSIYDTIVVDDKIKENQRLVGMSGRMTYGQMTSLSMNQVLLRSLNTSIISILPVVALLVVGAQIMGAVTLEEFSIALLVGMVVGVYSSIGVAAPVLVWMKEREPKNRAIRERLAAQGVDVDRPAARPSGERLLEVEDLSHHEPDPGGVGDVDDVRPAAPPSGPTPPRSTPTPPRSTPTRPSATRTPTGAVPPRPRKKTRKR